MSYVQSVSKITERGQITLPMKIRRSPYFSHARAVSISEKLGVVTITPIANSPAQDDHLALLNTTMHDWANSAHDDLFDFTS